MKTDPISHLLAALLLLIILAPEAYASAQPHAASLIGDRAYTYDANGNQLGWDHISNGTNRTITWDEENRIQAIADNGHTLTYVYDDAGERVIKSGPQGETAYVNQFFVVRNREVATKHVFAGGTRLVSKMASQPDVTPPTAGNSGQAPWGWLHSNAGGNSPNSGGTVFEKDQYYFHPDHLGSSSYVTDIDGEIFQHLEYFPFGETFVEESSNTQRTPYLFTGKELDEETGLYYFGARYYDPRTSVWQSPDPILAGYMRGKGSGAGVFAPSNLNLYGYVQNRPVMLRDPNGKETYDGSFSSTRRKAAEPVFDRIRERLGEEIDSTAGLIKASGFLRGGIDKSNPTYRNLQRTQRGGTVSKRDLKNHLARLTRLREGIGARGQEGSMMVHYGGKGEPRVRASAAMGKNTMTIYDAFYDGDMIGDDRPAALFHEAVHLVLNLYDLLPANLVDPVPSHIFNEISVEGLKGKWRKSYRLPGIDAANSLDDGARLPSFPNNTITDHVTCTVFMNTC